MDLIPIYQADKLTKGSIDDPFCLNHLDETLSIEEIVLWESSSIDAGQYLSSLRVEQKKLARTSEHYRQIGEALSISEAGCWKVGIIKPFPTKRVRALAALYKGPIDTFLRESLAGVPTTTLEFYVEDLDNLTKEASDLETLSVTPISFFEKSCYFLLLTPIIFIASSYIFSSKPTSGLSSMEFLYLLTPLILTALYLSLVFILISEVYRRASFSIALGWEILRRKGSDTPGASPLRICPI